MNASVIHRHGRFAVLNQRLEVMWPDGTSVALHPVQQDGFDSLFHRAIVTPGGLRIVFDLRKVCPPLRDDLPVTQARDVPGVVFYSLRHHLRTAAALVLAASTQFDAAWLPALELEAA